MSEYINLNGRRKPDSWSEEVADREASVHVTYDIESDEFVLDYVNVKAETLLNGLTFLRDNARNVLPKKLEDET